MSKALFFSDLHAANHEQYSTVLPNGMNSRLNDIINTLDQIYAICQEKKIDYLFMLGDTFHHRNKVDTDVFFHVFKAYRNLSHVVNGNFYILVGNHDQHNKVGSVHSLEAFKEIVKVIDTPRQIVTTGLSFSAMPFTTDLDGWKSIVKTWSGDLFIFHQGLSEASIGAFDVYIKSEIGLRDIPRDRFRYCFAGHYHKRQFFSTPEGNVSGFIGSPLQLSMGERAETKGFTVLDTDTGEMEFVESKAPKFFLFDSVKSFEEFYFDKTAGDFVRVRDTDKYKLERVKDDLPMVQVELIDTDQPLETSRVDSNTIGNDKKLLEAYIEQRGNGAEKEELLKLGLDLLKGDE